MFVQCHTRMTWNVSKKKTLLWAKMQLFSPASKSKYCNFACYSWGLLLQRNFVCFEVEPLHLYSSPTNELQETDYSAYISRQCPPTTEVLRNLSTTFIMSRYLETLTLHAMPCLVQGPSWISFINPSPSQPLHTVEYICKHSNIVHIPCKIAYNDIYQHRKTDHFSPKAWKGHACIKTRFQMLDRVKRIQRSTSVSQQAYRFFHLHHAPNRTALEPSLAPAPIILDLQLSKHDTNIPPPWKTTSTPIFFPPSKANLMAYALIRG